MTFTEAALEVLRGALEPLHYKKITELAITRNLLSHVGKTPEVTMSSRLATLVKKDRGQSPIIKVRPGVFALRESAMHSDKDSSTETNQPENGEAAEAKPESSTAAERPPLPGADVFPEEADDDFPILAGLEEEPAEDRGRRRKRRRRRSGKGGGEGLGPDTAASPERRNGRELREAPRHEFTPRHEREGRREPPREDRDTMRHERRNREPQPALDFNRQPAEGDLLGKDLSDAAYHVLARGERAVANFTRIAELLVRRGRLSGSPEALAPTVAAALRADAARAARQRERPRFRIAGQRVSLTEWLLPKDAVRSEESAEQNAEAQRDQVRRAFVARLNDLPTAGFAEIIASWLNAEGVTSLRAVRRPGSSGREFHFAGTLKRGAEENRLALIVLRSGRDLDRDAVVDARGSLHHYGGATGAWLVTTGRVNPNAREEAAVEGAAPCALFGGADLARAMEALGIGIRQHHVALCDIDFDLLESLGDAGLAQPSRERERDRDRDTGRERERDRPAQRPRRDEEMLDAREEGGAVEEAAAAEGRPEAGEPRSAALRNAPTIDLFDPEAAEASRLVPEAQSWSEGEDDEPEREIEVRPTIRVAPSVSEDDDEREAFDDDEPSGTEDSEHERHDETEADADE